MGALRKLFGPSKEEVWRQVSAQVGGEYDGGHFMKSDRVTVTHGDWTVTLDIYVVMAGKAAIPYTRLRAPYINPDGFRFDIYRKNIFTGIAKRFGLQDIDVGYPAFDDEFVIKGTDERRLKSLFANPSIRAAIERQKSVHLSVKDSEGWFGPRFPDDVDELYFSTPGIIKNPDQLAKLFILFAETLDELCRIGSAYEGHPQVSL